MSMKMKKSVSGMLAWLVLFTTILGTACVGLGEQKAYAASTTNLIMNPSFENRLEGWDVAGNSRKFTVTDELAADGTYSLKMTSSLQEWDSFKSQPIKVSPYTDYTLTFKSKGAAEKIIYKALPEMGEGMTSPSTDWETYTLTFNSKANSEMQIYLSDGNADTYFDDFSLTKNPGSLPINGDFETGDFTGWNLDGAGTKFSVTDSVYRSGSYGLKVTSSTEEWKYITQSIPVSPNTNYTLTFFGRGKGDGYYKIMTSDWGTTITEKKTTNSENEWKQYDVSFSSGENEELLLYFAEIGANAYFDDFSLAKSGIKPADPVDPINNRPNVDISSFDLSQIKLVDDQASNQTRSLYAYLKNISGDYLMFGHQNDTTEIVSDQPGITSDTYNNVNAYPAVFGLDMGDILRSGIPASVGVIRHAYEQNGTVTISDHMPNFSSGGNFSDLTPTVANILPGGKDNAKFLERLDKTAELAKAAKDSKGQSIPIIYRPFHENSGIWFWWGASNSTKSEFIRLWRYTVEYMRDVKGVDNFLYAYSPNGHFTDETDYLSRYPGDDYVDLLGFDMYNDKPQYDSGWMEATLQDARIVAKIAADKGKVSAFTETGPRWNGSDGLALTGNSMPDWYNVLHETLTMDPIAKNLAYMMVWRNQAKNGGAPSHFWVPFKGDSEYGDHEMLYNFVELYNEDTMLFADRVSGIYDLEVGVEANSASAYLMAPGTKDKIDGLYTLKAKVMPYKAVINKVSFIINGSETISAVLDNVSGYYTATFDTTRLDDGNVHIKLEVQLDSETLTDEASAIIANTGDGGQLDSNIIDDFESYNGDTSLLREEWLRNGNGDINILNLVPNHFGTDQGYALDFNYNLASSGYTGIAKTIQSDWSNYKGVNLFFQGDGLNNDILLQLGSGGNSFEAHLNDLVSFDQESKDPQNLLVPFEAFKPKAGGTLDLSSVTSFSLYVNGTGVKNSHLYLDNIQLYSEVPQWPAGGKLTASSISTNQVTLNWPAAIAASDIVSYIVYQNEKELKRVPGNKLEYTVNNLTPNTTFMFKVVAESEGKKLSQTGLELQVTTRPGTGEPNPNPNPTPTSESPTTSIPSTTIPSVTKPYVPMISNGVSTLRVADKVTSVNLDLDKLESLPLLVEFGDVRFNLSAPQINQIKKLVKTEKGVQLQLQVKGSEWPNIPEGFKSVGKAYYIDLQILDANGKPLKLVSAVPNPELALPYDISTMDSELIGIYEYSEVTKEWTYVGGKAVSGSITGNLPNLGTYAVLEYNKLFADVPKDHWAARYIQVLAAHTVIQGGTGNIFLPKQNVSRAEFIIMLAKALGLENKSYNYEFTDLSPSSSYANTLAAAYQAGWIFGDGEGNVHPEVMISRAEMAVIASRALQLATDFSGGTTFFKDGKSIPQWATPSINSLVNKGLIKGRNDNNFDPGASLTRAEAASIIYAIWRNK